ncbi:MAG: LytTR family transcriptional regulator DNA-binding domain-containing protein [Tannerella sp.]|jgi:hypothetical protein|nr:LytTR family transcriptional regulator DNA-binding domain-containing protein [Tannerella sp.]
MNPFNDCRKSHVTACFAVAVIYAFVLRGNLPAVPCLTDAATCGGLFCLAGFALWNIFRYALPASRKHRLILTAGLILPAGLCTVGIETFVFCLLFPSLSGSFIHTLPARLFVTLLLFVIIRLVYIVRSEKAKIQAPPAPGKSVLPPAVDRITVRTGQKIKIIPIEEIIYIKADGDYVSISTSEGSWLKEQTMKHTEDQLPADRFVRIHRSCIVNINHISRIERYGEKQQVVLHNNEKIKISATRYQTLRQLLGF